MLLECPGSLFFWLLYRLNTLNELSFKDALLLNMETELWIACSLLVYFTLASDLVTCYQLYKDLVSQRLQNGRVWVDSFSIGILNRVNWIDFCCTFSQLRDFSRERRQIICLFAHFIKHSLVTDISNTCNSFDVYQFLKGSFELTDPHLQLFTLQRLLLLFAFVFASVKAIFDDEVLELSKVW